jgi:hypothetical protein
MHVMLLTCVQNRHCRLWLTAEISMSAATAVAGMVEHAPEEVLDSFLEPMLALPMAVKQVDLCGLLCSKV